MTGPSSPSGFSGRFAASVLIGPALNPINTTMISVALVPIAQATEVPASTAIWLVAGLYLVSAVCQPTMGRLADLYGPRRVYIVGLVIAAVGGALPLLVPGFAGALVARLLIGVGTSSSYPAAMTLISDRATRTGTRTPRGLLSGLSISSLVTAAIGPVLGGVLVDAFGWQAIFLVNVPFALVAVAFAFAWLPSDTTRARPGEATRGLRSIDVPGVLLFAATMSAALLFLLNFRIELVWLLPVGVAAGIALVLCELRTAAPFIDVRLLVRTPALARTYLRLFLTYLCIYLVVYAFAQWAQAAAGFSSNQAGLLQLPAAVCAGAATIAVSRSARVRLPLVIAAAGALVGGVLLAFVGTASPLWLLLVVVAVFGVPQGLASVSNQAALYRQAPSSQIGSAAGLSRTSVQIGAIAASAVISPVLGERPTDSGLHVIAWIVAAVAAAALVLTVVDRSLAGEER